MRTTRPTILFVTSVLRYPPFGGPTLRIVNSIKALSQISRLFVYSRVSLDRLGGPNAVGYFRQYCEEFLFAPFVCPRNGYRAILREGLNRISRNAFGGNGPKMEGESEKDYADLLEVAESIKADVVWLGYGNVSYPLLKFIKSHSNLRVVVDTDSVWSRFVLRGIEFQKDGEERRRIRERGAEKEVEEAWGTQLADVTTAVSMVDAEYYRKLIKEPERIHLFSNVIDIEYYRKQPDPPGFQRPCVYLAGTFGENSPMEDAARWLVEQVMPVLRRLKAGVHLYVVGRRSDTVLADIGANDITIVGQVDSVLPYLSNATVAVVPLRFESGTRFKILEAGACQVPVVSTTLGAEGLPVIHGENILIADDPNGFAESVIRLIDDERYAKQLASSLQDLVLERFTVSSLVEEGQAIINFLTNEDAITLQRGSLWSQC